MEPFIGEMILFGGNFAPRGWAFCDGQLLPISQNTALFSILGTTYGGDGRTTFALPDMRGRAPVHAGSGPGLSSKRLGQKGGAETATLTEAQLPQHDHPAQLRLGNATGNEIKGNGNSLSTNAAYNMNASGAPDSSKKLTSGSVVVGPSNSGNQSHNNMQPFQAINYIIALQGVYPSRS